ncbi:hypothetical protein L1887_35851 [Cichorium endivia]|nr:hypothetical protein L1887_35851 [Cichorium endivia]
MKILNPNGNRKGVFCPKLTEKGVTSSEIPSAIRVPRFALSISVVSRTRTTAIYFSSTPQSTRSKKEKVKVPMGCVSNRRPIDQRQFDRRQKKRRSKGIKEVKRWWYFDFSPPIEGDEKLHPESVGLIASLLAAYVDSTGWW